MTRIPGPVTPADHDVLNFIETHLSAFGAPTLGEIAAAMGYSRATAHKHVQALINGHPQLLHRDSSGRLVIGPPATKQLSPTSPSPLIRRRTGSYADPTLDMPWREWIPFFTELYPGMRRLPDDVPQAAPRPPTRLGDNLFLFRAADDGMAAAGIPVGAWVYATLPSGPPVQDQFVVTVSHTSNRQRGPGIVRRFSTAGGGELIAASPGFEAKRLKGNRIVGVVQGWFVKAPPTGPEAPPATTRPEPGRGGLHERRRLGRRPPP